ncbi:helix-turn-helix domain-containing protein, partial [Glaesserella parasuis]|uniref:helix-turn-helix domain-containing protein n=1 Tax=Glaesserella parasuis TaxID=738 RepID=UPI0024368A97
MTTVGERIKTERLRLKLSQRDFSKLINISAEAQFKYEKNISLPRIDYLTLSQILCKHPFQLN